MVAKGLAELDAASVLFFNLGGGYMGVFIV